MKSMKKATFFSSVVFLLGLACFMLCATALGTTRWRFVPSLRQEYGLFETCDYPGPASRLNCERNGVGQNVPYVRATAAFMIMATILAGVGLFVSMAAAFKKGKNMHVVMGALYIISSLFLLIACSVYTGQTRSRPFLNALSNFGYSLWMAWSSTILSFLIIPFAFLAKRSSFA